MAQELTIYLIRSPKGINWKSPRTLAMSYVKNSLVHNKYHKGQKHPIGHVIVELKDSAHYALVGTTAASGSYMMHKVMHRGWAVGVLFATVDGELEEADINEPELALRKQSGEVRFLNYKLSDETFKRLWIYLEEYRQRGYGKYYNGTNEPRKGGGAGCSAFAYSFLEIGGLTHMTDEEHWQVHIPVQEKLIGGPESDDRKTSFIKLFATGKWADTSRHNYRMLHFYEPTKIYEWIDSTQNSLSEKGSISKARNINAKGITIEAIKAPTPIEAIWMDNQQHHSLK